MHSTKMMWLSSLMLVALLTPGMAHADIDPAAEYATLMARLNAAGRSAGRKGTPDFATVQQEINLKLQADLKDIDPLKIEPSKGLGWAQLFNLAGQPQNAIMAAQVFLGSNPDASQKYRAQILILDQCIATKDAVGIVKLTPAFAASDPMGAVQFALRVGFNIDIVADRQGIPAALELLKQVEAKVAFDQLKTPAELNFGDFTISTLARARADLFNRIGKRTEALAALEAGRKRFKYDQDHFGDAIQAKAFETKLIGSPAPPLIGDRVYGTFPGLDAYKGKIVLLHIFPRFRGSEYTSHYLSVTKKLYAELHSKGLEVACVTPYYSAVEGKDHLTPDAEFAEMKNFITKYAVPWPVLYLEKSTLEDYRLDNDYLHDSTLFPMYILIDRTGKVKSILVPNGEQTVNRLNRDIEELLNK